MNQKTMVEVQRFRPMLKATDILTWAKSGAQLSALSKVCICYKYMLDALIGLTHIINTRSGIRGYSRVLRPRK